MYSHDVIGFRMIDESKKKAEATLDCGHKVMWTFAPHVDVERLVVKDRFVCHTCENNNPRAMHDPLIMARVTLKELRKIAALLDSDDPVQRDGAMQALCYPAEKNNSEAGHILSSAWTHEECGHREKERCKHDKRPRMATVIAKLKNKDVCCI